ncbi:uncharacterized protein BDR25DRAFT_334451 [Lindgomyces ingoldianus]|uniref:Uncharacterized protein n=1 Tax=Lindgomyces ingoldianus TaxID=673940 RepID=A0ACB6QUZ6_9PLEO|nr:uncharacterized protein BDR25DRAFT_334451 [Lindgomyces ingoldianus]KAF2470408.1 hypothetical protein BDR25DRAFT_334451 [Lindgomyces ingoldianus]
MAEPQNEVLSNIRQYAMDARELQDEQMDVDASDTETRLEQTLKQLQAQVQEQQAALEKLRASSQLNVYQAAYASQDPRERLKQLRAVKNAYTDLTPITPFLPKKDSVLPALLAARTLQQNVQGTKEAIASTQDQITKTESALRREEANLHDANLINKAMQDRIERLQAQQADRTQKTPAQLAKELIETKREQKRGYDNQMKRLDVAFHEFISEYLAPMLAAEELGGPVTGDMPEIEDEMLAAGFTAKGKAKSTKKPVPELKRQRTIDQIWGKKAVVDDEQLTEAEAADHEMRKLIEGLFATLMGPGGGKAYFELERDSAASRFLVRAKIAQFHPKDARKLRLIDFGRELDD